MSRKAKRILRKLDYLPRWAWYLLSFFIGLGPFGPLLVYLGFHALEKSAAEEDEDEGVYNWDVNIDMDGVHVRGRSVNSVAAQYKETVKPMFEKHIRNYVQYADLIVAQGGKNARIVDILAHYINSGMIKEEANETKG